MNRFSTGTERWNGTGRGPSTAAMSESSSIKLKSVAQSLSGLGLDAANGGLINPLKDEEPPPSESGIELGPGLYFADGLRKVDYILCYKCKKRRGSQPRLSIASNGSVGLVARQDIQAELGDAAGDGDGEESKLTDHEKALMREEFEGELLDTGLEIERDKEKPQGLHFIRLHIPWPVLSREAELQKIKVAVKKKCELRERAGFAGMWDQLMTKISMPFQPDVYEFDTKTDPQTGVRYKTLKHVFIRDKLHLYDIKSTETLFDNATRSRIVADLISRNTCTQTCQTTGITSLLARGVYDSAFPLHDGSFTRRGRRDQRNDRQILHEEWANYGVMHKYQPVDLIRKYFGEQIGLYFAWLGVYTQLLIPPSVLGIIVFIYGILSVDANVPSQETCNDSLNITMCPLCDGVCDYWLLSSVCSLARTSYLFDNGVTVSFAIFMSLWAACFLEHWKRRQMCLKHAWDLTSLEDEEEELRPEYEEALLEKREKMREKYKKKLAQAREGADGETDHMLASQQEPDSLDIEDHLPGYLINVSTLLLLIGITFSAVFGVAIYRICMLTVWSMNPDPEAKESVRMTVTTTGIVLNMLVVLVLEEIYGAIAVWLTELELPRTEGEFEERVIFKSFFLKSMNAFAPIFYVAFFKGRFSGRPGDYIYVFADYRMEECAPPGCLIELCIQLSLIMLGKQLIQNNVFEVLIPKLKKMYRTMQEQKVKKNAEDDDEEKRPKQQFDKDFASDPFEGVTPEYMEMIIQYGFVSLFVASFPLAPAFALLNNVIEIRLDAAKFVTEIRRPDAVRCKDIGIWHNIISGISKFSVITNAFVISFTSEFIPKMLYQYMYSANGTMTGYTEHSLSYFNVSDFQPGSAPTTTLITGVTMCRYKDYRDPPWAKDPYTFSKQYWSLLAARLAFVIFFQNLAMFLSMLVAWMIPDVPRSLHEQLKKENLLLMEYLLSTEQETHSPKRASRCYQPNPANISILMESPLEAEGEERGYEEREEEEEVEEEEEEEQVGEQELEEVAIDLDKPSRSSDSYSELRKSAEEGGNQGGIEDNGGVGGGGRGDTTHEEKEEDKEEVHVEVDGGDKEMEGKEGKEGDGDERKEAKEVEVKTDAEEHVFEMKTHAEDHVFEIKTRSEDHVFEVKTDSEDHVFEVKTDSEDHVLEVKADADDHVFEVKADAEDHVFEVKADAEEHVFEVKTDAEDHVFQVKADAEDHVFQVKTDAEDHVFQVKTDAEDHVFHVKEDAEEHVFQVKVHEEVREEERVDINLDDLMAELGLLDEEPSSGKAGDVELPCSVSNQSLHDPPSKRGSSHSITGSATASTDSEPRLFKLIDPPPREPGSRHKARCSTLPSQQRGVEPCYSLPRPRQSTSLTKLQQMASHAPLVPLVLQGPRGPAAVSSHPLSPPHTPEHTPGSPTSPPQVQTPPANPETPQPKAPSPSELFMLKGPPPQVSRSRAKGRCSTLPARQRAPDPGESFAKPSHSTSFTKLGERVPPSPSELHRDTPV